MKNLVILFSLVVVFFSCRKEQPDIPEPIVVQPSKLIINIKNVVDGQPVVFNEKKYISANNDTFSLSMLKYFLSNFKFKNTNGDVWSAPESFHFIDEKDESTFTFEMQPPKGNYTEMEFSVGIDSINNDGNVSLGDIDPGTGMFWGMLLNYRFMSVEGNFGKNGGYVFHLGGNEHYKTYTINLTSNPIKTEYGKTTQIHIITDLMSLYNFPNVIDLSKINNVVTPEGAFELSENYGTGMISIDKIENPK